MKKVFLVFIGFAPVLTLAACGQSQVGVKKIEPNISQEAEEKPAEPKTTAKDVYDKTIKAAEGIQSYTAFIDVDQQMFRGRIKTFTNNVSTEYKMIAEPLAYYQQLSYDLVGESMFFELYSTEDGFYVYIEDEDMWGKFDAKDAEELIADLDIENPLEELEDLEDLLDEFELIEEDDNYILILKENSASKFEEAMKETANEVGPEGSLVEADEEDWDYVIKNMKLNSIDYKIVVDKATYYPLEIEIEMEMEVPEKIGKTTMHQTVKGVYSDYNSINRIEIPQEVIESAYDMEL